MTAAVSCLVLALAGSMTVLCGSTLTLGHFYLPTQPRHVLTCLPDAKLVSAFERVHGSEERLGWLSVEKEVFIVGLAPGPRCTLRVQPKPST